MVRPCGSSKYLLRGQFIALAVVFRSYEVDVCAEFMEELAGDGIACCWAGLEWSLAF